MINTIIIVLGASTLVQVLDSCGFLPKFLKRFFSKNKAYEAIEVLKEFGINVNMYKRKNATVGIPRDYSKTKVEQDIRSNLKELIIDKQVSVGKTRKIELNYYIDLIGKTCDENYAKSYARVLSSFWADKLEESVEIRNPFIDFIVTPKSGSPILGYEFAKLLKIPFILHEDDERFTCEQDDMRKYFDCSIIPPQGSIALIVDDSTTGGRLVKNTVEHLRQFGYGVTECLVVFEPQNKDARKKLSDMDIELVSIVKTHTDEIY